MADRWIYDLKGQPAFFQQGKYLYHPQRGSCEYWEENGWLYKMPNGQAAFYIQDNWIYTPQGKATYYYG